MEHRIAKLKTDLPIIPLIEIPYIDRKFITTLDPFAVGDYNANVRAMGITYAHPEDYTPITFRSAATDESVAIVCYMFRDEKTFDFRRRFFDSSALHAGRIILTQDGVWTNFPAQFDEATMKRLLTDDRKVNGIYLLDGNTAFVPNGFKTGEQDCKEFLEGGLARAVEHTYAKKAINLQAFVNKKSYPRGVYVMGFEPVSGSVKFGLTPIRLKSRYPL